MCDGFGAGGSDTAQGSFNRVDGQVAPRYYPLAAPGQAYYPQQQTVSGRPYYPLSQAVPGQPITPLQQAIPGQPAIPVRAVPGQPLVPMQRAAPLQRFSVPRAVAPLPPAPPVVTAKQLDSAVVVLHDGIRAVDNDLKWVKGESKVR